MEVTKTMCIMARGGRSGVFIADTIFIDGITHVVFEWELQPDGSEKPIHLVKLDPRYFHPVVGQGDATHMYEHPISDPRVFD